MQYRKLGRTDLDISLIGLGTMTWGLQNTQAEGFEQMDYALTQGINFFDTAEMYAIPPSPDTYGKTEEIIGNWFKQRGTRNKVILATKIAGPGLAWIREGKNRINKSNILAAVEASLGRLQTDRSEEHTSELQSRPHLVCRLLLEKKNKQLYQS